jgi:hypothetical protein
MARRVHPVSEVDEPIAPTRARMRLPCTSIYRAVRTSRSTHVDPVGGPCHTIVSCSVRRTSLGFASPARQCCWCGWAGCCWHPPLAPRLRSVRRGRWRRRMAWRSAFPGDRGTPHSRIIRSGTARRWLPGEVTPRNSTRRRRLTPCLLSIAGLLRPRIGHSTGHARRRVRCAVNPDSPWVLPAALSATARSTSLRGAPAPSIDDHPSDRVREP